MQDWKIRTKVQGWKMQDWKMTDKSARLENHENDGLENDLFLRHRPIG